VTVRVEGAVQAKAKHEIFVYKQESNKTVFWAENWRNSEILLSLTRLVVMWFLLLHMRRLRLKSVP
jgi:hypothetical protein